MQLYLDSYGAWLSVRDGMFNIRLRSGGEHRFAVRQVSVILMTKGTAMSADAALLATQHDIPVLLINANTHFPEAILSGVWPGSIAAIRRAQARFSESAEGHAFIAGVLAQKIQRQADFLELLSARIGIDEKFRERMPGILPLLRGAIRNFEQWKIPAKWNSEQMDKTRERFRGWEGTASRVYFSAIQEAVAEQWQFPGRQKRPSFDVLNALMNYLYGMLYTHVHLAILKCGLDPHMAILHADQYGERPTLAYDLIEPYRPWADAVALELIQFIENQIDPTAAAAAWFEPDPETEAGLWLSFAGKDKVISSMRAYLETPTLYEGRQIRRGVQIDLEVQQLAVLLKNY